jgi:hypothetical protein
MATRRLSIALVFLAGCAVGGASSQLAIAVPPARAGAPTTRWEYFCVPQGEHFNPLGAQGWELVTAVADVHTDGLPRANVSTITYCFKRQLP